MEIYIFSSNTLTNIWAGIGAKMWAVHNYNKPEFITRAKNMPLGALGLFYCVESKSFTTPFLVAGSPEEKVISNIWPEEWILPFNIKPLSDPNKQLHKDNLNILPLIKGKENQWHHKLHIQANTAFSPTVLSNEDWSIILDKLL